MQIALLMERGNVNTMLLQQKMYSPQTHSELTCKIVRSCVNCCVFGITWQKKSSFLFY